MQLWHGKYSPCCSWDFQRALRFPEEDGAVPEFVNLVHRVVSYDNIWIRQRGILNFFLSESLKKTSILFHFRFFFIGKEAGKHAGALCWALSCALCPICCAAPLPLLPLRAPAAAQKRPFGPLGIFFQPETERVSRPQNTHTTQAEHTHTSQQLKIKKSNRPVEDLHSEFHEEVLRSK